VWSYIYFPYCIFRYHSFFWPRVFLLFPKRFFVCVWGRASYKHIWCKYIGHPKISSPPVTRVTRDARKNFWKTFFQQIFFLYCWATFLLLQQKMKNEKLGLFLLVVATKKITDFSLLSCIYVGAHLKKFSSAHWATHLKITYILSRTLVFASFT